MAAILPRALIDFTLEQITSLLARTPAQHLPTLLQGNAGIALFHAYRYLHEGHQLHLNHCIEHVEAAVEATNSTNQVAFLGTGFTGLSWVIAHLMNQGILDDDAEETIEAVRPLIITSLTNFHLQRDYDLFYGFMGIGLFFAEDASQNHAMLQEMLLLRLEALAITMPVGIAWNSSIESGERNINLGLAHGSPSIILFLLGLHQQGIAPQKSRALLEQALAFLLTQELPDGPSLFPFSIVGTRALTPSRLAWCYGDLAIAYVLLRVGEYFQDASLKAKGLSIALHAAGRDAANALVQRDEDQLLNTSICHGTAGLAFLFRQVFELTGASALEQRAYEWLDLTLEHLGPKLRSLLTDFSIKPFDPSSAVLEQRYGLLEGIAGTGLVLTAFVNPQKTEWSRLFLLNN